MRFRRVAAATVVAAVAGGGALLINAASGSAASLTPTPITLAATGLGTTFCPLPINGTVALKPGTTVLFTAPAVLQAADKYSLAVLSEAKTTPAQKAANYNVPNGGVKVAFPTAGTYQLSWKENVLGGLLGGSTVILQQQAKLIISSNAQACTVAVNLPTPSVSVPIVPSAVNSIVNGVVGSVVGGANSAVAPVNSAVGPILGSVNSGVGGLTGGGTSGGAAGGKPAAGPSISTIYTPTDETGAQRTVPRGGGAGGGANSGVDGQSINAANIPFKGVGTASGSKQSIKSGGSPNTVELAANKPRSALDGWANLIVLAAVLALSGATAFYARTYLLHPLPAKVKASS